MKVLADTSVLVAAHLPAHTAFPVASSWLNRAKLGAFELVVSAHTLAETYSVLTRLPLNVGHFQRVWPNGASRVVSPLAMTPP